MEEKVYKPKLYTNKDLKNKSGIYQIRNLVNNKIYIGSSCNLYKRKRTHFYELKNNIHKNSKLQKSFNKYGEQNFIFEVIEFCSKENQYIIEQYWIDRFNIVKTGYNIQPKVESITITDDILEKFKGENHPMYGKHHTNESKLKMSQSKKGKYTGVNSAWYGKHHTEESKNKIKNTLSKLNSGDKNPFYGKCHTEKTKNILSDIKSIKVICLKNNVIYKNAKECSLILGISQSKVQKHCTNKVKNPEFKYI